LLLLIHENQQDLEAKALFYYFSTTITAIDEALRHLLWAVRASIHATSAAQNIETP
jgi:hypothetical protein